MKVYLQKFISTLAGFALVAGFALNLPAQKVQADFTDVMLTSENATLGYLAELGVFEGYPDGTFRGLDDINRAELAKVIVEAQGITPSVEDYNNCFLDVQKQWFAAYICYAQDKGWVEGYASGHFLPKDPVNRAEVTKMILEPLLADEVTQHLVETEENIEAFSDLDRMDWFAKYVGYMFHANLVKEPHLFGLQPKPFSPSQDATRNYVADLLGRVMMMSQNGWDSYHPYLQDELLLEMGLNELVTSSHPCYHLEEPPHDMRVLDRYLHVLHGESDAIEMAEDQLYNPFASEVCYSKNGDVFVTYSTTPVDSMVDNPSTVDEVHLKVFSKDQGVTFCPAAFSDPAHLQALFLELDVETLEMLNCLYLKDKEAVYYLDQFKPNGFVILEGADPADFRIVESDIADDLAQSGDILYYRGLPVENFEALTMEFLGGHFITEDGLVYFVDSIFAYQASAEFELLLLEGVSPDELDIVTFENTQLFEPLAEGYHKGRWAMVSNDLYFANVPVTVYDPGSFEVISTYYARDDQHVYALFDLPDSLQPKPDEWVLTDQKAHHSTFKVLAESFLPSVVLAMDKDQVYFNGEPVSTEALDLSSTKLVQTPDRTFILEDANGFTCSFDGNGGPFCLEG